MARRIPKNPFDDEEAFSKPARGGSVGNKAGISSRAEDDEICSYGSSKPKPGYDDEQGEGYVNQAVVDLQRHAINNSQETTSTLKNCIRVAEETMGIGAQTLVTIHDQGIQIERTHEKAVDLDQHLSRGEKLLGSLGGVFSKPWRPKTRKISGPSVSGQVNIAKKESAEDREALGLGGNQEKKKSGYNHDKETFEGQINSERETQDDMLDDLSTIVSQMKEVSMDLGTEIERQAPLIEHFEVDVRKLNTGVKDANRRGQRLLRR